MHIFSSHLTLIALAQLLIIIFLIWTTIVHLIKGKYKIIFAFVEITSYLGLLICLFQESVMTVLFPTKHYHYGNNSFNYYAITLIILLFGHLINRFGLRGKYKLYLIPFSIALLLLSVTTLLYCSSIIPYILFPVFGLLLIPPITLSLVLINHLKKEIQYSSKERSISEKKMALIFLISGGTLLILFQLIFLVFGDDKLSLLDVFIHRGSFGLSDIIIFD